MSAIRAASSLRMSAQRTPVMFKRYYAPDSRAEGATGSSTGFKQRENAEEGQYIKRKEAEQLKAAQEKKAAAEKEIEELEKKGGKK